MGAKENTQLCMVQSCVFGMEVSGEVLFEQVLADVATEVLAFEMNLAGFGEGLDEGFLLGLPV